MNKLSTVKTFFTHFGRLCKTPVLLLKPDGELVASNALARSQVRLEPTANFLSVVDDAEKFKQYLFYCNKNLNLFTGAHVIQGEKYRFEGARYGADFTQEPLIMLYFSPNKQLLNPFLKLNQLNDLSIEMGKRKLLQQVLHEKNAELEILNKALAASNEHLEQFAYTISHDLKAPLRGINHYTGYLIEDYQEVLDADGLNQLQTIVSLTDRMELLLKTLLEYSRISSVDLSFKLCDIHQIVQDKIALLHPSFVEEDVAFNFKQTLPSVYCDHVRLGEVFQNLIVNGVKYNEQAHKSISFDYRENEQYHVFSVADNGIGIKPDDQEKVFQMFKRLHGKNDYGGGTGAGMSIVKKIVERHQGDIWLESELGQGTTFYFSVSKELQASPAK